MDRQREIYFVFTDTGTYLSKVINFFTKKSLNHVSIAIDRDLKEVYSFGRIKPNNPFSGGFVKEDIRGVFLKNSKCAIYMFRLTHAECRQIISHIRQIEMRKSHYKYNFIGLIGVLLNIEINRKNAYFCSQFVATVMQDTNSFSIEKPACFITPADIRAHEGMELIYQGILDGYKKEATQLEQKMITEESVPKPSLFLVIGKVVKQFVMR